MNAVDGLDTKKEYIWRRRINHTLPCLSHCQETVNSQEKACPYLVMSAAMTRGETLNQGLLSFFVPWAPLRVWWNLRTPSQKKMYLDA
jgi:glucose-6-phosphate dehydrogenase assembly protein OpcA